MTFLDVPAIPLPGVISRFLATCGVYTREQAGPILGSDPERYSIKETADAYGEWNDILLSTEDELKSSVTDETFLGLPCAAIVRGLLRRVNSRCDTGYRFVRMVEALYPSRDRHVLAVPKGLRTKFEARGLSLDGGTSRVLWFVCKCALLVHASFCLSRAFILALLDGARARHDSGGRPILWWDMPGVQVRTEPGELNALDYVREGRLPLFQEQAQLYVRAPWVKETRAFPEIRTFVCQDAIRASRGQRLRLREFIQLFRDTLAVGARVLCDAFREDGLFLLLASDYASLPRMRLWFQNAKPRAIVITNSMYSSQPLWMAYSSVWPCEIVMLFYATNVLPFYLRGDPDPLPGAPGYRLLECTRFEVWTEGQKAWLVSLGIPPGNVNVAGIIVLGSYEAFQRRDRSDAPSRDPGFRIGVFDVIPVKRLWSNRYGMGDNYYSVERMSKCLVDIVEVAEEVFEQMPDICLKPKRGRLPIHDERYLDVVGQLVRKGRITAGALPENPINAVAGCDMVISPPFSSPSEIAVQMGVPSCFYDPVELLRLPPTVVSPEVPLISGREQLRRWMLEHRASTAGWTAASSIDSEKTNSLAAN